MDAKEITLNIAVNLGRLCRWSMEGRRARVDQFLVETQEYLKALEAAPKSTRFLPTYEWFKKEGLLTFLWVKSSVYPTLFAL